MKRTSFLFLVLAFALSTMAFAEQPLSELSIKYSEKYNQSRGPVFQQLKAKTTGPMARLDALESVEFLGINSLGWPIMAATTNLGSAQTMQTDELWPDGSSGYDLTGSTTQSTQLGVWDGGIVLASHQEFGDRVVIVDTDGTIGNHPTHVAGSMVASGFMAEAHGMSPEAMISSYDWNDDTAELASAAETGMLVTNHSYVYITGWIYDYDEPDWYWFGDPSVSETEDYSWGFYSDRSRELDELAFNAPYMLMCWAAGNDRGLGPQPGREHYVWNPDSSDWVLTETARDRDGGTSGFDCISHSGISKNVITVGAIEKLTQDYENPWDVVMSSFSGWGPADDGRVKPDLVVPGVQLTSPVATGDDQYATWNGTSMATPSLSGTISLLQEQYRNTHEGASALAATMKAILINTAEEAGGMDGPDYRFGWGLVNAHRAADMIALDGNEGNIFFEENLFNTEIQNFVFTATGEDLVKATIVWTDPAGEVIEAVLDSIHPALVNDLDLRITNLETDEVYMPWHLDAASPYSSAVRGDNTIDNVEVVQVRDIPEGTNLEVSVSHKGILENSSQDFSLVISGMVYDGVGVDDEVAGNLIPETFTMSEPYPNPFNPTTTLTLTLPENGVTGITVFDINGRQVYSENRMMQKGDNQFLFDSRKLNGELSSGIYFITAEYGQHRLTRKLTLMK